MEEIEKKESGCIRKIFKAFIYLGIFIVVIIAGVIGWAYYELEHTNDLEEFASKKLSRPGKYDITIKNFQQILPTLVADNVEYVQHRRNSSFTIDVSKLTIVPDLTTAPKIGTHTFTFQNASMYFKRPNFFFDCKDLQLEGKYSQKHVYIATSTWDVFRGKIFLSGHIDTNLKPSPYEITATLRKVKLEDILAGTKHKGLYTGNVYGSVKLKSKAGKKSSLYWTTHLEIPKGTYRKPELIDKINNGLKASGLRTTLGSLAEKIASNTFSLKGDFDIVDKVYKTQNAEIETPLLKVRYKGAIGPKSALDGDFYVEFKNYTEFHFRVKGPSSKEMKYYISDPNKTRILSILAREVAKGTEKRLKRNIRRIGRQVGHIFGW